MSRRYWARTGTAAAALMLASGVCAAELPLPEPVEYRHLYGDAAAIARGISEADAEAPRDPLRGVAAVVVPHHLTAASAIARGIGALKASSPRRVVLLSPDHFKACRTLVCTTEGSFPTAFGEIATDHAGVAALLRSPLVSLDSPLFLHEHGVLALLPFLRSALPLVRVVPLVLSQGEAWYGRRTALVELVESLLDDGTAIVVSSDFSHGLPIAEADRMDEATAKALFGEDLEGIARLRPSVQTDCRACLWLLASVAGRGRFYNPSALAHTNSARLLGGVDLQSTTSHFAMAWLRNAELSAEDAAFAGDVTLTVRARAQRAAERPPESLSSFWSGSGPRVVNLEGPLAERCPVEANPFLFCNEVAAWRAWSGLATHWVTVNNHMFDRGVAGWQETLAEIEAGGRIPTAETPMEVGSGTRLFGFTTVMNPVPNRQDVAGPEALERLLADLAASRDGRLNAVIVHGGAEYRALIADDERELLKRIVDAGADAVLVIHSHVVSDMEVYRGKPIFHGMGNFVFDQRKAPETSCSKIVRLRKDASGVRFETKTGCRRR